MEKITSIVGALQAGKMPTHKQICGMIHWLQATGLTSIEPNPNGGTLSVQGKTIVNVVRELLEAYKAFGEHKNEDNIMQRTVYHLKVSDPSETTVTVPVDTGEVQNDAARFREALRTLLSVTWTHLTSGGESLLGGFGSFARLSLADVAEVVEGQAHRAKEELRKLDDQVGRGERDDLGRTIQDKERAAEMDAKQRWETGMDSVKVAGSTVIDTSTDAKARAHAATEKTKSRLWEIYNKTCHRAQTDPEYRRSLDTVFEVVEKWLTKSIDTVETSGYLDLESLIQDPTPEQHTIKAIRLLREFVERIEGKPLDDLFSCIRQCIMDVRQDPELKAWFERFFAFARKSLDEPGYATSEEAKSRYQELSAEFKALTFIEARDGKNTQEVLNPSDKKWKQDFAALKTEAEILWGRITGDGDIQRLHRAHVALGKELASIGPTILQQASWIWGDIFQIYAPKVLTLMENVPIPRTEYKDSSLEFVLENIDISSLNLHPAHVQIRNLTDVDIKSSPGGSTTAVGTLTHLHIKAIQMALRDVSFYYHDKTVAVGPSEITGILAFTLPQQGIDVDIKILSIPTTPAGLKERAARRAFCTIEMLKVHISQDVGLEVRKTNHKIVMALFKPFFIARFREAIELAIEEQIRSVILSMDALAWSVSERSQTFADTGMNTSAAYVLALYSEFGRLRREGSLGVNWKATGSGIITERDGVQFAMGAAPQILSARKSGPMPGSYPLPVVEQTKESLGKVAQTVQDVRSFKDTVDVKAARESERSGWESFAFDV